MTKIKFNDTVIEIPSGSVTTVHDFIVKNDGNFMYSNEYTLTKLSDDVQILDIKGNMNFGSGAFTENFEIMPFNEIDGILPYGNMNQFGQTFISNVENNFVSAYLYFGGNGIVCEKPVVPDSISDPSGTVLYYNFTITLRK